jgi:hypothetical protein
MKSKFSCGFSVLVIAISVASCAAQTSCPDWSSYFDQIDDPAAVQQLQSQRAEGWPSINPANNGGNTLQQSIAQSDALISQIKQQMSQTYQSWAGTRASSAQTINVTHAECQSASGANTAAACEYHNLQNELLSVEGMNDLMRCRAGMPQAVYGAVPEVGGGGNAGPFTPGGYAAYKQGADSVAAVNVMKRGGMVSTALKNWKAPIEQQDAVTTLAQNASLTDPFSDTKVGGTLPNNVNETADLASSTGTGSDDVSAATAASSASDAAERTGDVVTQPSGAGAQQALSEPAGADVTDSEIDAVFTEIKKVAPSLTTATYGPALVEDFAGLDNPFVDIASGFDPAKIPLPVSPTIFQPLVKQENVILNDFNGASGNLFDTSGTADSPGSIFDTVNTDLNGLGPAWAQGILNQVPGYDFANRLYQGILYRGQQLPGLVQQGSQGLKNLWSGN